MGDSDWVATSLDDGTIDDGGVKIHLPSIGDEYPQYESGSSSSSGTVGGDSSPSFSDEKGGEEGESGFGGFGDLKDQLTSQIAGNIFKDTSTKAKSFLNFYGHIDWIRPYFNVEPSDVLMRLLAAVLPGFKRDSDGTAPDLYGATMVVFTLTSIIMFTLKASATRLQDGTLMGAAFGLSFSYWSMSSFWYFAISYAMTMELSFLTILSVSGYSMIGFCLSLLPNLIHLPTIISLTFFVIFGVLSASSLGYYFFTKAPKQQSGMVAGALAFATHLIFLFYLFSFFVEPTQNEGGGSYLSLFQHQKTQE
mmetsp:Transcript_9813/g.13219  ORF Transcript_9813/g.13219 Transcript_9813/m.13219 type:complete len:307 (-) Transcript_9813:32-952(-)